MAERKYKGKQVIANCLGCGREFTYTHFTGMCRKHCSARCRMGLKKTRLSAYRATLDKCAVDGCSSKASRVGASMCEMHYYRMRRSGDTQERMIVGRYLRGPYVLVLDRGHPLATTRGTVAEHRSVAYEKYFGVCQPCYWCAEEVTWKTCHVDHINGNGRDNQPDNLVVSCARCNRSRGAVTPYLMAMTDAGFERFIEVARRARADEPRHKTAA